IAAEASYRLIVKTLESLGFRVKLGANIFKDTYGYLASEQERADDLNRMVADGDVKMVLFSGGSGAAEILPLIDYENISRHPKLFSSYSDATFILSAIYAKTGLVTYYGLGAGEFRDLRYREYTQFAAHFFAGNRAESLKGNGEWRVARPGVCDGVLIGGYAKIFVALLNTEYFRYDPQRKYILFLEAQEKYTGVAGVSADLSLIEQNRFIGNVSGLIFGHYSENVPEDLLRRLARFGEKHGVPVVYTDDFGHGARHSIIPIGVDARLKTDEQTLLFI
ncbi:MAG: LD-carboxypeptidase, partial [Defluviitaleaceae bacterium]|nr:LD-carboxypeptidase [Defluviitaleaceae bacterium]